MSLGRPIALALLIPFFLPAPAVASGTRTQHWQEGEILSRKTVGPSRHHAQPRYIYRIKADGMQYVARFDRPLSVPPYEPLKFSVARRHLFVRDADGSELKASLLHKSEPVNRF